MVMMNEAMVMLMMAGLWLFGLTIAYQHFVVIRRLRRKIDALQDVRVAAPQAAASAGSDVDELQRVRKRLEVLERITVEKENGLAREIDALGVG